MQNHTVAEVFQIPTYEKPRALRQTWLKDVGYDEAPYYVERMGLVELADFLEVASPRLDFVKIVTTQVLYHPSDWLKRKIKLYQQFNVEPYLDHTYFMHAYQHHVVDEAIVAGRELGFRVIEFMNTGTDVTPQQWKKWRKLALENEMSIIFEHHPLRNWDPTQQDRPSSAEEISEEATTFLEDGAFIVMIDHEEFDLQGKQAADEIGKVVDKLGLEKLVFEATSPKEGPMIWYENLSKYFKLFGSDCNVANIMPSQAMFVEPMRSGQRL